MDDADDRAELLVLTHGWTAGVRAGFLAAYAGRRTTGASHEEALMRALAELLP